MEDSNAWVIRRLESSIVVNGKTYSGRKLFRVIFPVDDFGRFKTNSPQSLKVNLANEIVKAAFGDTPFSLLDSTDRFVLFGERK